MMRGESTYHRLSPRSAPGTMKIAKPLLLVMTPIGVGWGLVEAWRFRPILAMLMALLLGVISLFIWLTVRTIRKERANSG